MEHMTYAQWAQFKAQLAATMLGNGVQFLQGSALESPADVLRIKQAAQNALDLAQAIMDKLGIIPPPLPPGTVFPTAGP